MRLQSKIAYFSEDLAKATGAELTILDEVDTIPTSASPNGTHSGV
jgi:hypothetical protein